VDGREIKAVVQLTKQAIAYVFDRVTGEPVWPIVERPVPGSETPGEWISPTQPFPTKPAPFDVHGISVDTLTDLTPELREEAMEIAALAHATTTAMAGLADTLREIPLLAHDALQTEMDLHWPRDERDEITLSVEGISLTAQPGVSSGHAARAAAYLANLATISPPLSKDAWPFYQIQGHIVRAPGPGWAYLKLQLLISASLAARPDIRRALTQECPRILRIETEADMEADLAGLRLS